MKMILQNMIVAMTGLVKRDTGNYVSCMCRLCGCGCVEVLQWHTRFMIGNEVLLAYSSRIYMKYAVICGI
jgi:hypothetical protein